MKLRIIMMTVMCVVALGIPAMAQTLDPGAQDPNDKGLQDSIIAVLTQPSINGNHSTFKMDLYFFNDSQYVASAGIGFKWENPNLVIDSAKLTPAAAAAYQTSFFFYKNNRDSANAYKWFQLGVARFMGNGLAPAATRTKVAEYFFHLTDWSVTDTICIDSIVFSGSTITSFVDNTSKSYKPFFAGLQCVGDPDAPQLGTLVADPTSLSFEGDAGGTTANKMLGISELGGAHIAATASTTTPWITLTNATGTTPYNVTVGVNLAGLAPDSYDGTITVTSDGAGNTVIVPVHLVVTQPNRAPVLAAIGTKAVDENALLEFGISATDPDETTLLLSASGLPTGAAFVDAENGTGTFTWTPTYNQAGEYPVTFVASDGALADTEVVVITVVNVNRPPVMGAVGDHIINEQENLHIVLTATDPDEQPLQFLEVERPFGSTFTDNDNNTATFDWTPTNEQSGSYILRVLVMDGAGGVDSAVSHITVIDIDGLVVNPNPLVFSAVLGQGNPAGQSFHVAVSDGSVIDFTLTETAAWFALDPASGGTTPTDVMVTVDVTGLAAGTYEDSILVAPAPNKSQTLLKLSPEELQPIWVYVNLTLTEPPKVLAVDPTDLYFVVSEGDLATPDQTFDVTEVGDQGIDYSAIPGATWITVADSIGTTPGTVAVNVLYHALDPGTYLDSIEVAAPSASNSPLFVRVHLTVTACPVLEPSALVYDRTIFAGETASVFDSVLVTSTGPEELPWGSMPSPYFWFEPQSGMTPSYVSVNYERTFGGEGIYADTALITSGEYGGGCYSQIQIVVNVTVNRPPSADTVIVVNTPAVPGMRVMVPVTFSNSCPTSQIGLSLTWPNEYLVLDSVSFVGSAVSYFQTTYADIFPTVGEVNIEAIAGDQPPVPYGSHQRLANLFFTLNCEIPAGSYPIELGSGDTLSMYGNIYFIRNCGEGDEAEYPEYILGNIIVGTASDFVCGYVVDPDMNEIEGATVELWQDFPFTSPLMSTLSSGIGSFAFDSIMVVPFDLYAYKDGYYPGLVEAVNFGEKGIIIVLHPIPDFPYEPSSEWVDFYCPDNSNMYFGGILPVGSVVEAYTQDGLKVGQKVVTIPGQYGFMPVYRGSVDLEDDGAQTGDAIRFTINQYPAIATGSTIYPAQYAQMPVCLEVRGEIEKECELFAGWNLISWNVDTDNDNITDVLGPIMPNVDVVLGFERGGLTYDPDLPEFSTLSRVDHMSGYWVRIKNDVESVTLTTSGLPVPISTPIPVTVGWNLVSYLPEEELDVEVALLSIMENLRVAYGFDTEMGIQIYKPSNPEFSSLDALNSCHGYWVKTSQNDLLIYPEDIPVLAAGATALAERVSSQTEGASLRDQGVVTTTNWVNMYSSNLTVDGRTVPAGATITAHAVNGDQLVGSFITTTDGKFGFMAVYADGAAEEVTGMTAGDEFYLMVNDVRTDETFEWSTNGDRIEVVALSTSNGGSLPTSFGLQQNYPNPFNPETVIGFTMPATGYAKVEVFNILGRLIATPFDGTAQAGQNQVTWNGRDSNGEQTASGVYLYRLTADKYTETKKMMLLK